MMSNEGTEDRIQRIVDEVTEVWKLPDRDDLLDDCLDFVEDNYSHSYEIKDLVIEFLSKHCANTMSTADLNEYKDINNLQYDSPAINHFARRWTTKKDLKSMAIEDQEREETTYEEATQGE